MAICVFKYVPHRQYFAFRRHMCSGEHKTSRWQLPEVAKYLLGFTGVGLVVAYAPILPETKTGLQEAFSHKHRACPPDGLQWVFGGLGFFAGYRGALAYVDKIGRSYPVLAGFKTPWALFGALLGGQLSSQLTPLLFDASGIITRVISFTADGLTADTVGRPRGRPPAWGSDYALSRVLEVSSGRDSGLGSESGDIILDGVTSAPPHPEQTNANRELLKMAGRLVELRRREAALQSAHSLTSYFSPDREALRRRQAPELAAIAAEKRSLKDAAMAQHGTRLSAHLRAEVGRAAGELTQLRLRQYALARELAAGGRAERRAEIQYEIKRIDSEKARLKRAAHAAFGQPLSRVARSVPSTREAMRSAAAEPRA